MVWHAGWMILLAGLCTPSPVAAEILDRIEIVPTRSETEIHISFTTPVVYQSHFPVKRSDFVRIEVRLPQRDSRQELRRERLTSPPSDLVPAFIVSFPERSTSSSQTLSINFRRPVDFTIRSSRDRTSIVIAVPLPRQTAPFPSAPSLRGAPPSSPQVKPPPGGKRESKTQAPRRSDKGPLELGQWHEIVDRIQVTRTRSSAEIRVLFKEPVVYLYHFPKTHGEFVRVWVTTRKDKKPRRLRQQIGSYPPKGPIPGFTVTFPDQEDGRTKSLLIRFAETVTFNVRSATDKEAIIVAVPLKTSPSARGRGPSSQATPSPTDADVRKAADELMAKAGAALSAGRNETATQIFNTLLMLPPNQHSQEAQELVGVARERSGELAEAFAEYELYLELYPESEGAARVRQRLAALKKTTAQRLPRSSLAQRRVPRQPEASVFGSVSQYYFFGQTRSETELNVGGVPTTLNDKVVDQSLFVTTLNLTGRSRTRQQDSRIVLRGTNNLDTQAPPGEEHDFRLRRAYLRHEDKERLYLAQVGRQFGNFGGILNPYDGGWFRYGLLPGLHLNAVGGLPLKNSTDSNLELDFGHYFYGGDLSLGPFWGGWSGDGYFIAQMVDGIVDRRATGAEVRYAANRFSVYSLVDYDLSYDALNIAMVNGSWQSEAGTLVTALVDLRKTPSLQTTNGLLATGTTSVREALQGVNEDTLRQQALALTANSLLIQVGLTYPWTTRWQLGGDLNLSRISDTDAAGNLPAMPGTGMIRTYTLRALGRDVLLRNHTFSVTTSYIDSPIFDGQSLVLNSLFRFKEAWQLDTTVTLYHQVDDNNVRLVRVTPSARLGYRWGNNLTFEVEAGLERADTTGLIQQDLTLRQFFSAGIIWEH